MPNEIPSNTGYVVGTNHSAISDLKGYSLSAFSAVGTVSKFGSQAVLAPSSSLQRTQSYVPLVNPAAAVDSNTYAVSGSGALHATVTAQKGAVVMQSFFPPHEDLITTIPFVAQRFPECVSYGSSGGPGFKTTVFEVDSGLTSTEIEWDSIRSEFEVSFDHVPPNDIASVESFFYGMRGRGVGFLYKDWSDFTISNQNFLVGDGIEQRFQLFKRYNSGGYIFDRIIRKPVVGTAVIAVNGVVLIDNQDYFINESTGEISFVVPPPANALGTVIFAEFDVSVRFDSDFLNVSYDDHQQLNISGLPLIEIL